MFEFIGKGGMFDIQRGNTSAYHKRKNDLFLIDCGDDIFTRIIRYEVLKNVGRVYFSTHMHSDHIGSLSSLLHLLNLTKTADFYVIYPKKEKIEQLLELVGFPFEKNLLTPEEFNALNINVECTSLQQQHFEIAPDFYSYGYILKIDDKTIYYSGDCSVINEIALKKLLKKQIDYFYHEANLEGNGVHTKLSDLDEKIPKRVRDRVYLMHINRVTEVEAQKLGFKIVDTVDDFDFEPEDGKMCLILGSVASADKSQFNKYKKLKKFCKNYFELVFSPLDTMKFAGTPSEIYKRAVKMIAEASIIVADVSTPSTGGGMELFRAKQTRAKKVIVVAEKKAKVSSLILGAFGSDNIVYYSSMPDLLRQLEILFQYKKEDKIKEKK